MDTTVNFTEFILNGDIELPQNFKDIDSIVNASANIEFVEAELTNSFSNIAQSNFKLTGKNLLFTAIATLIIEYTSANNTSIHGLEENIIFTRYIVLPKDYILRDSIELKSKVDDISIKKINKRKLSFNLTLLVYGV